MGNMESLGKRRAFEFNDSSKWEPIELLEDMVEAVKTGRIKPVRMLVLYVEERADESGKTLFTHSWITSRSSWENSIAMLHIALKRITDAFMM